MQLYRAFVRPKLEYAVSSFVNLSNSAIGKVNSLVNEVLRKCLGLLRSTPLNVLYHMAAELPTRYRYIYITAKELAKAIVYNLPLAEIFSSGVINIPTSMSEVYNRFIDIFMELEQISQIEISCDRLICYPDFFGEISTSKKSIAKEVILRIHGEKVDRLKSQGVEIIYTDGSVSNIGTNYAFFIPRLGHKQSFHSDKILSSTSAELLAISEAIVFAMKYNLRVIVSYE